MDWNSKVSKETGRPIQLESGVYDMVVADWKRGHDNKFNCPQAELTLKTELPNGDIGTIYDRVSLRDELEWKLCQLFTCMGLREHGEEVDLGAMFSKLHGSHGKVKVVVREGQGEWEGKTFRNVEEYMDDCPPRPDWADNLVTEQRAEMDYGEDSGI